MKHVLDGILDAMERTWTAKAVASYDGEDGQEQAHSEAFDIIAIFHAEILLWELGSVQPVACVDMAIALEHG